MENTLENKAKFFAQYFGQKVLNYGLKELIVLSFAFMTDDDVSGNFLELTPLSDITDEDAKKLSEIILRNITEWDSGKQVIISPQEIIEEAGILAYASSDTVDFLRLRGYAVRWNELEVEQQIEYGWIKLKEATKIPSN